MLNNKVVSGNQFLFIIICVFVTSTGLAHSSDYIIEKTLRTKSAAFSFKTNFSNFNTSFWQGDAFVNSEENSHFHEAYNVPNVFPFTNSAACYPGTINRFTGSYHSNLYIGNSSGANVLLAWGQQMLTYTGTGTGDITVPTIVSAASYGGIPIEVRSSSSGGATGNSAMLLRTTTKLYVFGTAGNLTGITSMAGFGGIAITTAASDVTAKLPAGVAITDIARVAVSQKALAIVTNSGHVYMLTTVANLQGDKTALNAAIWHHVTLSDGVTFLSGITKISLSSSGAFALNATTNKLYYWGSPANVAGVVNIATSYNYAFDMSAQIPAGKSVTSLVVLGAAASSASTLFILCNDNKVYGCGLNTDGILGINNATTTFNQPSFITVKGTDGTTDLSNIVKIDGDTEADLFCMGALSSTGNIFGWGNSSACMLGVNATTGSFTVQKTVQLFSPTPGVVFDDFSISGHFTIAFYFNGSTDQYWYLGHNLGGSLGDPTNVTTFIASAAPASLNAPAGTSFDCSNATLPVDLLSFNGRWVNEQVALSWKTASELNANYFVVERSTDAVMFHPIGAINAVGNSNYENSYSFIDQSPVNAVNFYRLKTVDIDSKYQISSVLKLNKKVYERLQVSPNPFNTTINVQITLTKKENGFIRIIDNSGKTLFSTYRSLDAGASTISLNNLPQLSEGTYLLEVQFGSMKTTKQIFRSK